MRTVSREELPENDQNATLIKSNNRKRQQRLNNALETTLRRCHEMHAEQHKHTAELRILSEKEGFSTGFHHFFNMLLDILNAYEALFHERLTAQRQQLQEAITQALYDPIVVDRIVAHLHEHCDNQNTLTLVLPAGVSAPATFPHLTCVMTDDKHITLQCGMRALRFPIDSLCQEWMQQANQNIQEINTKIATLIPSTLQSITEKLQRYEQHFVDEYKEKEDDL